MKIDINKLGLKELSLKEKKNINGGFFGVLAAIAGVVYLAGEIAESAGRAYRKNYL